jgi:hypothetical protein
VRVPHVFRLFFIGVALIAIAALTTVGVYAVVAGGLSWATSTARTALSGAPVLVTIQAAPATPTSATTAATPTPGPAMPRAGSVGATPAPPATAPGPALTGPGAVLAAPAPALAPPPPADSRPASTPLAAEATLALPSGDQSAAGPGSARPPASTPRPADAATPSQGDPAPRAAHEGLALEIVNIERGWDATMPDGSPAKRRDGSALLTVQVRLSNETADLRYLADTDLVLVAEDGARLAPRQASPQREPHLLTMPVPPRDSVRGWLTYEIPSGLEPKRLQWSPTRPDRPRADATYLLQLP